jgi:S1-C subfamily serine protease
MGRRTLLFLSLAAALGAPACRKRAEPTRPAASAKAAPVKIIYPAAPGSFVKLVSRLAPSVVNLSTTVPVRGGPADWLQTSPPSGEAGDRVRNSLGSGFLVDRQGHILTSAQILARAETINVRLGDAVLPATVRGTDPATDVALLRIKPPPGTRLTPARLGDSDSLRVGEWLLALGNPFGEGIGASSGILGSREVQDPVVPRGERDPRGLLQTDAAINPGNAGGPLVNMQGEVVGICTTLDPTSERGPGLAVPIGLVNKLLPMLKREGRVVRTWLGIYMAPVTAAVAARAKLKPPQGAVVTTLIPGGPAARAGLRSGDIILTFDGAQISDARQLPRMASLAGVGRQIAIKVWRDGKQLAFTLKTEAMPE